MGFITDTLALGTVIKLVSLTAAGTTFTLAGSAYPQQSDLCSSIQISYMGT